MSGVLEAILRAKTEEIGRLRGDAHLARAAETSSHEPFDVVTTLRRKADEPLRLIAEIKRRSPSAGPLSTVLSPGERGCRYRAAGASMISVLCDGPFFDGSFADLESVRAALNEVGATTPLLAKEFVLDEIQLAAARAHGADTVLLIARIVDAGTLRRLVAAARGHGLEPLVEVVTEAELEAALAADAILIGVNARDLDTLQMDAARASRVLAAIPDACVPVHLSGLKSPEDVASIASGTAHAALIGEALMRQDDPSALLGAMAAAASRVTKQRRA